MFRIRMSGRRRRRELFIALLLFNVLVLAIVSRNGSPSAKIRSFSFRSRREPPPTFLPQDIEPPTDFPEDIRHPPFPPEDVPPPPSDPQDNGASTSSPQESRRQAEESFGPTIAAGHAVAVVDVNGFHDEVHGAVLWTLSQFEGLDVRFYRGKWRYKFDQVIARFWATLPQDPKTFIDDLRRDTSIRHVFLTTCDWDWYKVGDRIEEAWRERPDDEKFNLACLRHWNQAHVTGDLAGWAEHRSLALVGLGDHVRRHLKDNVIHTNHWLDRWTGNRKKKQGLLSMPIKTFIPIFPAESYPEDGDRAFDARDEDDESLRTAFIQSTTWDDGHRNLTGIYADLRRHLEADSEAWGYTRPAKKGALYKPIPDHPNPFRLYLAGGSRAWLPKELKLIVHSRVGYSYPHFYGALKNADIVLPAFGKTRYDKDRASSTMGVAGTAPVPLLVSQSYADAYGYFCPAFGVIRPDGVSEIDWIAKVRNKEIPFGTRKERQAALLACQEEWTAKNMGVMAEVLQLA